MIVMKYPGYIYDRVLPFDRPFCERETIDTRFIYKRQSSLTILSHTLKIAL